MKPLTVTAIKNAKPKSKPYKMFDGGGLFLLINPHGSKLWRFKYRFIGTEKQLSLGTYPETSLKMARRKRTKMRSMLAASPPINPSEERKARKATKSGSFRVIAEQWFRQKQSNLAPVTRERNQYLLDRLSDRIGMQPISKITTPDMKVILLYIQKHNGPETARRARGLARRVFAYAIADGMATFDPTAGLQDVLQERHTKSRSALTKPAEVGKLLLAIDGFTGQKTTRAGLQLLGLNFTRPTEIRLGKWTEIDLKAATWEIPASRMKMRNKYPTSHMLPLSEQSVAILEDLKNLTGGESWVFPTNTGDKPLSENAFNNALNKLGYGGDKHTAHGFRSTASTILHELSFPPEVIETQLAHARPGVAAVYNRAHLLPQRRKMLQAWADHLDQLKTDSNVIPIRAKNRTRT